MTRLLGGFPALLTSLLICLCLVSPAGSGCLSCLGVGGPSAAPPSFTGLADIIASPAWYVGLRGVSAAYASPGTGCAVDLVDQAGANALTCVVIKSNGDLDTGTISAWVTAHSVTTILITKWYDQISGTNNLVQATVNQMPILQLSSTPTGKPCALNDGSANHRTMVASSSLALSIPYTHIFDTKRDTPTAFESIMAANNEVFWVNTANTIGIWVNGFTVTDNQFDAVGTVFNGATSTGYFNGSSSSVNSSNTGAWTTPSLWDPGFSITGNEWACEFATWSGDKSASFSGATANVKTYWGGQ